MIANFSPRLCTHTKDTYFESVECEAFHSPCFGLSFKTTWRANSVEFLEMWLVPDAASLLPKHTGASGNLATPVHASAVAEAPFEGLRQLKADRTKSSRAPAGTFHGVSCEPSVSLDIPQLRHQRAPAPRPTLPRLGPTRTNLEPLACSNLQGAFQSDFGTRLRVTSASSAAPCS